MKRHSVCFVTPERWAQGFSLGVFGSTEDAGPSFFKWNGNLTSESLSAISECQVS